MINIAHTVSPGSRSSNSMDSSESRSRIPGMEDIRTHLRSEPTDPKFTGPRRAPDKFSSSLGVAQTASVNGCHYRWCGTGCSGQVENEA